MLPFTQKWETQDFPGGRADNSPPATAQDMGSIPDPECSTFLVLSCRATKPVHHNCWALEPMLPIKRSHPNEKPTHCNEEEPLLTTARESPHTTTKSQCSQKNKRKKWETQMLSGARKWCEWAMTVSAKHQEDGASRGETISRMFLRKALFLFALFYSFFTLKTCTHQGPIQQSAGWQPPSE